jgi:hypothetical protein
MAKVKQDWAREKAEQFVAASEPGTVFATGNEEERDIKRLAALLRRTFEKGYQIGINMGDSIKY